MNNENSTSTLITTTKYEVDSRADKLFVTYAVYRNPKKEAFDIFFVHD